MPTGVFSSMKMGEFVEGCYITALLAKKLLQQKGNGIVIFDPRAVWAVEKTLLSGQTAHRFSVDADIHLSKPACAKPTRFLLERRVGITISETISMPITA